MDTQTDEHLEDRAVDCAVVVSKNRIIIKQCKMRQNESMPSVAGSSVYHPCVCDSLMVYVLLFSVTS